MENSHSKCNISLSSKALANILELIKMMTGLKNFNEVYMRYVQILNNLQDEYYEYPKQSQVEHNVRGLLEKYCVQGFPLEAKEFEMRVYNFVNNSNINNPSNLSTNDIKWAIISMIINMANNPCGSRNAFRKTNLRTVRIELEGEAAVLSDSWKSNLIQELLDIGTPNYMESDNETETDSEDVTDFRSLSVISPQTTMINDNKHKEDPLTNREYLKLLFSYENTARNLLMKRASEFWWLNKSETIINDTQMSTHFALKRYSKNNIFKTIKDNFVILECLKNHITSSYILQYCLEDQVKFFGRMTILSSISPEVFNQWISTVSPHIKKFDILMKFINNLKGLKSVPYTLRAYAKGLEQILEPIVQKMNSIENRIKNSVGHDTILSFEEEMSIHFQIISFVFSVHSKALIPNWNSTTNWKTSIKLISELFWFNQTAIVDYQKSIVMTLFLYTFEPYVHMTELWIHAGQLIDVNNEFVICNYEGDYSTAFNIYFKDVHGYLENCNLNMPPILECLLHFLNNCDWKVFVASQVSDDAIVLCDVPRGELFHSFLTEIKNSNNMWTNYITPFNEYNPSSWNQLPMLASCCVNYKFTDKSSFDLTIPSSHEMVGMFFSVVQNTINNIGLKVRDIFLKENKFVHHLKILYNILVLGEINAFVSIDRFMEYKIERNLFLNNNFYTLLNDDHSSVSSNNHSFNLSLNYKTETNNYFDENNSIIQDNFAEELEGITICSDVKFPLSLILTQDIIVQYNKIFRLLMTTKQAVEKISRLQTKDLKKYDNSLDAKRMYFIRLWIMSTTYKLQTYFFSVVSKYLGFKLFDSVGKVNNGLEAFEKVLKKYVSQATKLCMLDGLMETFSYESLGQLWNACEQFTKLWTKSVTDDNIDIELMEKTEQEYVNSCWKLATSLDTYLEGEDDRSSILYEFSQDFMSSMPTKESADLDGSLIYKLSDSRNSYSFTYI